MFFSFTFENLFFPLINQLTRTTKASATAIVHILTNIVLDFEVQSGIIKNNISDLFAIFLFWGQL